MEELSLGGLINEVKDGSTGSHSRRFCFVIGAGASKTSGIKSGQDLVDVWSKELANRNYDEYQRWRSEFGITEENRHSFYSHYYEKRYKRNPSDGYNYLEKLMESAKPSSGYIMLAYLLSKTDNNVVITTNFDHLIEDAINYYVQIIPLVIGHESLSHYITKKIKRPTIVKIHRDLLFDPANTVNQVESLHDGWKKALSNIFSEYNPIFIGYAGNDNSLMNYLVENGEKFASEEWNCPYWMLYGKDKIDNKVSEFLYKSKGYFINHNGFDEVLCLMSAALNCNLPSREDFIGEVEKRYDMLSDAIDAFTDKLAKNIESFPSSGDSDINRAVLQVTDGAILQRMYRNVFTLRTEGKYADALLEQQELINMKPHNARYHNNLGITLHEMKRYDEALAAIQKAVEFEPDNASYHNSLGDTLYKMKRYDEALAATQKAVELEPDSASYHNNLGDTLHKMKRYDEALAATQKAVDIEPDNELYLNSLGVILHEMKRYDEALAATQKVVELEPNNAIYYYNLSFTLHEMKRYDEALVAIQKAVELEPDNARYHNNLGITLHEMKRYDEALAAIQKAVEFEPDNASYNNSLGIMLREVKRYDEALAALQKAIELEFDNASYHNNIGILLHWVKRYDEALAATQKAVELEPDNGVYIWSLGATLYRLEYYCEALNELNKAISKSSVFHRAYIYRGLSKIRLELENSSNHFDTAIDDLNMALKICPTDARNYRDRAEGYLLIDGLIEAEDNLKEACNNDDQDPDTYHLYALLFEKHGDIDKAKQFLQKAKALGYIEPLQ